MERRIVRLGKDGLLPQLEKGLHFILNERTTHIEFFEDEDESGRYLLPLIKYNIYDEFEDIYHGFSTRYGGTSSEHLSSLNLSFSRGDDETNVRLNHERLARAAGYETDSVVFSDQVHDKVIRVVTSEDCGKGITRKSDITGVDGLITNEPGVTLMTFYADCVPNYFYDPVKRVVGLAHSGWKGTVKKIGTSMIESMQNIYGCKPSDIICAIGPSICKDCYEVSKDVADLVREAFDESEFESLLLDKGDEKYMLNLHAACKYNLLHAGVVGEHIALPDLCTCCNFEFLYSHRASKGMRGNLAAFIGIKK